MSCRICGRTACTESFHSLEEQEEFETKTGRYAEEDRANEYFNDPKEIERNDTETRHLPRRAV